MSLPTPITRSEQYLSSIAGEAPALPVPITREERYLAKIAGEDVDIPAKPITRTEQYLAQIIENGSGAEVESLSVSANGEYTAPSGKAYSPVTVNVPNSYAAGDEGKVVSNGTLVAQTSDSVTQNGTVDTTLINSLEVNVPQGGGAAPEKDVNFIDYDGTILYSYTADEFAALDALPANPSHDGLTAQGWNWTLAGAKDYVANCGFLDIGQNYVTTDGNTRLYIRLTNAALALQVGLGVNGSVVVDWGDGATNTLTGTSESTIVYTPAHTYATTGEKIITLIPQAGANFSIRGTTYNPTSILASNNTYSYACADVLCAVELGNNVSLSQSAFFGCYSLKTITLPKANGVVYAPTNAFENTFNLRCVVFPDASITLGDYCLRTSNIVRVSFPQTPLRPRKQIIQGTPSLKRFAANFSAYDLTSNYGDIATNSTALERIAFGTHITGINTTIIGGTNIKEIVIPASVTSLSYLTMGGNSPSKIEKITLPDTLTTIGAETFRNAYALKEITIPAQVTSIGSSAFASLRAISEIHFRPTTPPAVSASNAFSSLPNTCIIYVPAGTLSAYTSASNYPSSSTYTYIEE